ncbi:MAG: HEAT repeat domain-containing protein [Halobacteriovoraceae bacterium]|nr:HEAT repeat domain-containing protein [Halobacteriovoraceae bacterium]
METYSSGNAKAIEQTPFVCRYTKTFNLSPGIIMGDEQKINKSAISGIAIPFAIVIGGALIIWAITKMLGAPSGYKKLVEEMHSKTFGNRWVAAYELSKYISTDEIPEEDIPWLIDQLSGLYDSSQDFRTKNFLVIALGSLKDPNVIPLLNRALNENDKEILFNCIVAIGNMPHNSEIDYKKLIELLGNEDSGIQQVAILTLSQHKIMEAKASIGAFLQSSDKNLQYTAATGLLFYGDFAGKSLVEEILLENKKENSFNADQMNSWKLNVLRATLKMKNPPDDLVKLIKKVSETDPNLVVSTNAKQVLIELKKQ